MNLDDVRKLVSRLHEQKLEHAYLQATKPLGWRPKGYKFRTCFGLAHILNVIDRDNEQDGFEKHTSIVFTVELEKIERWVQRQEQAASAPRDRWMCLGCGRCLAKKVAHNCRHGFQKKRLEWVRVVT